ncbi:MAG: restriction endonuclease subunit S [Rhodanobacteraceae bacterium]
MNAVLKAHAPPENVALAQLGEVVDINPRFGKDELTDGMLASFVPMKCVEEESGRFAPLEDRKVGNVRKGYTSFRDRDVIFAKVTPCMENGKAAVVSGLTNGIGFGSTEFFVLRPSGRIEPKYLLHFVVQQSFRQEAARNMTGAVGLRRVPKSWLEQQRIPLPSIAAQREIVAEIEKQFTRLDAGVAALRRVQANLKRYRAAVLKAACEGRLVPTRAKWHRTTLGDVTTVLAGYGFPKRLQGRPSGDIGFYKVGDISEAWKRHERILTKANHYISRSDQAELRAKLLPPGTVVFAKIGAAIALNRRAVIGEPSLVDNNVMGVFAGERIHPRYLFHFLCTQKLDEVARATTVPSIRKGDVQGIELDLPSLAEQSRIVDEVERRMSVIEELEAAVAANLQRATRLRQSVLQKAFAVTT